MKHAVLQSVLPSAPWMAEATRRLPGMQPLDMGDWLCCDEAYAGQMALRDRLIAERRAEVFAQTAGAEEAAADTLDTILAYLPPGFVRDGDDITRPDGGRVTLDADAPLVTAGRLVQQDLCVLQKPRGATEHVLTAAILCFPASWTLAEKIGRPLTEIHTPVAPYTEAMGARVQRLFDGLKPDRPLWRQNALLYADPALFQPRPEAAPRRPSAAPTNYLRSERQSLIRLPRTGAVLFSIHTYVLPVSELPDVQRTALAAHPIDDERRTP